MATASDLTSRNLVWTPMCLCSVYFSAYNLASAGPSHQYNWSPYYSHTAKIVQSMNPSTLMMLLIIMLIINFIASRLFPTSFLIYINCFFGNVFSSTYNLLFFSVFLLLFSFSLPSVFFYLSVCGLNTLVSRSGASGISNIRLVYLTVHIKAWTFFAHSNAGIVASNPTQFMDVCVRLFCLCCPVCR
jgi:hypothetical protein